MISHDKCKKMVHAARIRKLRLGLGLTQEQAAALAGFKGRQRLNEIEKGRRSSITMRTLEKVAKALNVKSADLLR